MRKKLICMALTTAALSAAILAGCGKQGEKTENTAPSGTVQSDNLPVNENGEPDPLGIYQEPVKLKIAQVVNPSDTFPEGQSATKNAFFDYFKENLNIDVEVLWQSGSGDDYNEKLNLAISSGELPDIISVNAAQLEMLIKAEMIEDLTPYYEKYAGETMKNAINSTGGKSLEAVTYDDKIMALPNVKSFKDGYDLLWIRQDWLDKLNLEAPKNIEELRSVAKAFIENNMGGANTVGLLGPSSSNLLYANFQQSSGTMCGLDGIFQGCGALPGYWVKDSEEEVVYGSLTPETKEALSVLAEMYREGTLDQELGMRKDADEAWKSGQAGMFFGPWWVGYNLADALAVDPGAEWLAYPYPLTDEGRWAPHMPNPSDSFYVVRKGYEHPEIIFMINNQLLVPEVGNKLDGMGILSGYIPGRLVINTAKPAESDAQILFKYLETGTVPEYDVSEHTKMEIDINTVKDFKLEPYDDLGIETWNVSKDGNFGRIYSTLVGVGAIDKGYEIGCDEGYSLLYGQTESMQKKWSNLKKIEDETFLKIILGTIPVDEFDTFAEEWHAQGGTEITGEVAEAANK